LKLFKLSIVLLSLVAFLSCATQGDIKPPKTDSTGNIEWKSSRTPIAVTITSSYGYKLNSTKTIQEGAFTFDYSIFTNESGGIIAIIDFKRTDRAYDKGADLFEPGAQSNGLLKYEPYQFTIWTGVSPRSFNLFKSLGIKYPQCKVVLNSGRLNDEDTTTAVFVIFVEPWTCDYKDFEEIIDRYNDRVFIW
jgi:hypothetical protein